MNQEFPPEAANIIFEAFNEAGTANINTLQQFRDVQLVMGSLLQHEAKRLEKKLGRENGRVQQIQATIKQNQAIARDLDVELEIAQIRVPDVDSENSLIQGRVVDENYRGLVGLTVALADVNGNIVRTLGNAQTQNSGYYALIIEAEVLRRVAESIREGVLVVVCNSRGELLYRHKELFRLVGRDRVLVEIVLDRGNLNPICD